MTTYIDGAVDQRWPLFSEAAKSALGACTIYAFPIKPGPQTMGVATFYQVAGSALSIDPQVGQFLVNAVGVALVSDPDVLDEDRLTKEESWSTQARIHQATGMVMAQLHLGVDDALALVRAHAYAHNSTLSSDQRRDHPSVTSTSPQQIKILGVGGSDAWTASPSTAATSPTSSWPGGDPPG